MTASPQVIVTPTPAAEPRLPLFLAGQAASLVGSQTAAFALPLVAVVTLNATPTEVGLLTVAVFVPNLLAPLFAGPIADGANKRALMMTTDVLRGVLALCIPVLYLIDQLSLPGLLGITVVLGLCSVLYDSALFAFIPFVARDGKLLAANGGLQSAQSLALFSGPGVAGALTQAVGAPLVMLVDSVSYLFSWLTLRVTKPTEPTRADRAAADRERYADRVRAGFSTVWRLPAIRLLGFGSCVFNLFSGVVVTATPLFVIRSLGISPGMYGLAMSVGALGGIAAGLACRRVVARLGFRNALSVALAVASLTQFIVACGQPHTGWTVALFAATQCVYSFAVAIYVVANATLRQHLVPPELHARVYAVARLLSFGAIPLGGLMGGLLVAAQSPRWTLVLAGVGQVLTAAVFAMRSRRLPSGRDEGDDLR